MTENEAKNLLIHVFNTYSMMICKNFKDDCIQEAFENAITALEEIQQYRAIGTVEECREAMEKQKAKKPVLDSCEEKTHYKCHCGHVFMTAYSDGYRMGNQPKYCECCGQAIDWSEVN